MLGPPFGPLVAAMPDDAMPDDAMPDDAMPDDAQRRLRERLAG